MKIKVKDLKLIIERYLFEQEEEAAEEEEVAEEEPVEEDEPAAEEEPSEEPAGDDPTATEPAVEDKSNEQIDNMVQTTESERDAEVAFSNFLTTFKTLSIANPELEVPIPRNLVSVFPKSEFPEGRIKFTDVKKAAEDGSARAGINKKFIGM